MTIVVEQLPDRGFVETDVGRWVYTGPVDVLVAAVRRWVNGPPVEAFVDGLSPTAACRLAELIDDVLAEGNEA